MKSRRIRVVLLIFLLILAGLIVWFKIVPNGQVSYSKSYPAKINLLGGKGFIGTLTPADRVLISPGQMAKISGDPIYFSVFTPRTFSSAKITVTYQDNLSSSTPVIEAGVLVDNILWRYQLAPIENRILDENFKDWYQLRQGETLLYQKNKDYSSVADFLATLKNKADSLCPSGDPKSCLALYNTDDLNSDFPKVQAPSNTAEFKPFNIPLQGAHQFYFTKPAGQALNFSINYTDLNLNKDADSVTVSIYLGTDKIYSKTIPDNFGGENSGVVRNFSDSFSAPSLSDLAAVYKLEIKADDDIVIKKIVSAPSALNIISRIHPVAVSGSVTLWTDSQAIQVSTNNPASAQKINFGGQTFNLSEAYKQFEFVSNQKGPKEIKLVRDDVIIAGDGVFSLAAEDLFNPQYLAVYRNFTMSDNLKYVLANYEAPKTLANGLKQATVALNTQEAYRENGKYSFIVSVPGLSLYQDGNIQISNIKVEFSGRTVWDKLKESIAAYAK